MKTTLMLTFPKRGAQVALGCANSVPLRYEVRKTMCGDWQLTIWEIERSRSEERSLHFPSQKQAKSFARADFRRRQILRAVAA